MNPTPSNAQLTRIEEELERLELRMLEAIWSLERAQSDQLKVIRLMQVDLKQIKQHLHISAFISVQSSNVP